MTHDGGFHEIWKMYTSFFLFIDGYFVRVKTFGHFTTLCIKGLTVWKALSCLCATRKDLYRLEKLCWNLLDTLAYIDHLHILLSKKEILNCSLGYSKSNTQVTCFYKTCLYKIFSLWKVTRKPVKTIDFYDL